MASKTSTRTEVKFFNLAGVTIGDAVYDWRIVIPEPFNACRLLGFRVDLNAGAVELTSMSFDPNFNATLTTEPTADPGEPGWIEQVYLTPSTAVYDQVTTFGFFTMAPHAEVNYYVSRAPYMINLDKLKIVFGGQNVVESAWGTMATVQIVYRLETLDELTLTQLMYGNVRG